jgi:hypothetical protein
MRLGIAAGTLTSIETSSKQEIQMLKSLIAVLALMSSAAMADDHIDIKGLHLGMTQQEVETLKNGYYRSDAPRYDLKTFKELPFLTPCVIDCKPGQIPMFTIGGRTVAFNAASPLVHYTNQVADRMFIGIPNAAFDDIQAAVITKYPTTKCADSDVSNALNAHFTNTTCTYQTATEVLVLTRYADLQTMALTLDSVEHLKAQQAANAAHAKDL